MIDLIYSICRN